MVRASRRKHDERSNANIMPKVAISFTSLLLIGWLACLTLTGCCRPCRLGLAGRAPRMEEADNWDDGCPRTPGIFPVPTRPVFGADPDEAIHLGAAAHTVAPAPVGLEPRTPGPAVIMQVPGPEIVPTPNSQQQSFDEPASAEPTGTQLRLLEVTRPGVSPSGKKWRR